MAQEEHQENASEEAAQPVADTGADSKREISTISFPYGDLEDAVSFAKAVHEVGGQSCLSEQLAGYLKVVSTGGAFRARMAYPRIFGLVDYDKSMIRLTPLGMRIVDPAQEAAARVDAFLNVPLYKAIYDLYKGYTLPPPAALEREMGKLGVSTKQTDKARQVFDRSAKQAGFHWAGSERLTLPVIKSPPDTKPIDDGNGQSGVGGPRGGGSDGPPPIDQALAHLDPLLIELLKKIPAASEGWMAKQRLRWFRTFAMNISQIYDEDDAPVDLTIGIEGETRN